VKTFKIDVNEDMADAITVASLKEDLKLEIELAEGTDEEIAERIAAYKLILKRYGVRRP
jgi:hypothetical protein